MAQPMYVVIEKVACEGEMYCDVPGTGTPVAVLNSYLDAFLVRDKLTCDWFRANFFKLDPTFQTSTVVEAIPFPLPEPAEFSDMWDRLDHDWSARADGDDDIDLEEPDYVVEEWREWSDETVLAFLNAVELPLFEVAEVPVLVGAS